MPSLFSCSAATCSGILALLDEAALHAVGDIGELDAAVADRRAAMRMQDIGSGADCRRDGERFALQEARIAVEIADHLRRPAPIRCSARSARLRQTTGTGRDPRRSAWRLCAWAWRSYVVRASTNPSARMSVLRQRRAEFCHGAAFLACLSVPEFGFDKDRMADQVAQRQSMHRACAASLMLLFGACSTGEQVVAPTGTEQAGFVPSAPPDNQADPAIVTAGDLVEQKKGARTGRPAKPG